MSTEARTRFLEGRASGLGMTNPITDLTYGAQLGYGPDMRYWTQNANQKRQNLIPIVLELPRGLQYLNDPEKRREIMRAMFELHPRSIEGLDASMNVDVDGTPVGGDGQQQQEFVNVTRAQSQPTFVWDEKYGRPIGLTLEDWVTNLMADPATKVANVVTRDGERPTDMLPDQYSMSMMFIEPDPTWLHVVKCFICVNMFPFGKIADYSGSRDLTQPMNLIQYNQQFTALTSVGPAVNMVGKTVLDGIRITNANPNMRASFIKEIAPDVLRAANGFAPQVADFAANNISQAAA